MKMIKKMLCVVIILAMVLCGCGQTRETKKNSEPERAEKLCVLYTPENEILISNFENLYPEYELEKVLLGYDIDYAMENGTIPDLIIADGSTSLMEWYERGYIQEFGSYYGEDEKVEDEDYFPGALEVGREADMLLALPLSAQVPYMTVRESVAEETLFGNLSGEYTLDEYLDVLREEYSGVIEKGTMVVSGVPFGYDFIELLFATGAITVEEGQVEIDQAVFEKLYGICVENCRNYQEDANVSTLVYRDAAIDPRDGDYKAAYWYRSPPQVGVLYAQSVNRHFLDEDIKVFWWPMAGEAGRYAAEITTLGMIGAESQNPQAAYEVLRLMMDMPMKEWIQPQRNEGISINMYMPVHIENSKEMCTYVETSGLTQYSVKSTGNEYEVVEKQEWDEGLKESVLNMLDGIEYVYRMDSSKYSDAYAVATFEYIEKLKVNGVSACYEDVLKLLQQNAIPQTPLHDGNYFSFSPSEYTNRLGEILETLGYTQYSTDYVIESYYQCIINDNSKSESLGNTYYSHFNSAEKGFTEDQNAMDICEIWTVLNDRKYENLFPVMSAILMTCDPSLNSESAIEAIESIPISYSETVAMQNGVAYTGMEDPYYHNGIGYIIYQRSFSDYQLIITLAEE